MILKQIRVNTASELIEMSQLFEENEKIWLYRGHSNANWPLLSSFERFCINYGTNLDSIPKIEDNIIRKFCSIMPEKNRYLDNILKKMVYLQHNGCATRLIDVTTNFSKACFFALYDVGIRTSHDSSCCIWCFNQKNIYDQIVNNSILNDFYENISEFRIKSNKSSQLFGNNLASIKGVLLIGDWADPDHQIPQNGMAILNLDIKKPSFQSLFSPFDIPVESQNKVQVVDFNTDIFMRFLTDSDMFQIILKDRALLTDCEKLIFRHFNLELKNLFPNGINSKLADLNNYIKCF